MEAPIINKVSESGLITLDLEIFYPADNIVAFDLAPFLFRGLILKEKEFRDAMQEHDWNQYDQKVVAVFCSADAIIPAWAYMLVSSKLSGIASKVYPGSPEETLKALLLHNLEKIDTSEFTDKRVVIKGCGDKSIGDFAYLAITNKLTPVVKSLMYGEPCSTVPVYKKR